jgi:hypothetical protein
VGCLCLYRLLDPCPGDSYGRALWPVWRRARISRQVVCPASGGSALVILDPWYAVRMHALGDVELRVKNCGRWPADRECGCECLGQIGPAA